tara:strand:- start:2323 stop:2778 length:456 start_codon:yes stop_codon:yes gene_type:complete
MPERVTKEERMVTLAIEKARKTIETMRESTQVIPVDTEVEVQKIKRPKVQDASKITNQTQDKEGYGLAGESLKKSLVQKRQTPTSFEQVVQMADEELQSGRVGVNKEILSNIKSLARQEIRNGSTFSEAKLKEIIENASRYNAIKDYMGLN